MENIIYASNKAMLLIVLLSAIPVMVATVVGLLIGLIQTVTQLQEQTLLLVSSYSRYLAHCL
uniref:YsaS n=1 Tax=Yersinia enterocolitica TaxID=630 RepID=Q9KKH1_YEREN|nr:YsaS [Yersinia enterocolitica]